MKKNLLILVFGFLLYNSNITLFAYQQEDNDFENTSTIFDDDDFIFDNTLNFNQDNLKDYVPVKRTRSITSNTDDWAALLLALQANGQIGILNQSIYKYTSPIRTRTILDYPFALTYGFDLQGKDTISIDFYGNISWPKNFTKHSQLLRSYLNTDNQEIIDILDEIVEQSPLDEPIDIGESLALFSPGKVVELRAGGILQAHVDREKWYLNAQLPIQYVARAFYLTPAERKLLFNSQLASLIELSDDIDQDQFYYDNFYVDQFGLSDLKLKAMYQIKQTPSFDIYFGGFIVLPIATAFAQGMIGTWIDQDNNNRAYLDLRTINPEDITIQNQEDIAQFFMAALDQLNSNILYPLLGNNGHVVVAPSCNFNWYFTDHWKFCSDDSFEIPLRAYEQRFYKATQSYGEFITQFNAASDDANTLVLFANQKLQDMFFPYVYKTLVWPGIIVNSTNQFVVFHDHWNVQFGGNYWYQAKEQIYAPVEAINYDLAIVPASSAAQGKIFGQFNYNFNCQNTCWSLSAYTDITIWNSGIGNDYTLGLFLGCSF